MSQATPIMRDLAKRLVACEARQKTNSNTNAPGFHVCERLRPHLARLMGNNGYFTLCSRALALASAEVLWLKTISVRPEGVLEGLEREAPLTPAEIAEGEVVLVARLLGLLATFIGEDLMLHLVQEVWTELDVR